MNNIKDNSETSSQRNNSVKSSAASRKISKNKEFFNKLASAELPGCNTFGLLIIKSQGEIRQIR
jgi:hypothetical protein